ncbi:hypothetical protein [Oscillibacter sp.]|uniref:hypothetical protein n=1 Tax=Oscillibacter sp. TaxID=1945593 RepID=UPI0028A2D7A1|nr:hypothetical protein [Oscillibacter sp.]
MKPSEMFIRIRLNILLHYWGEVKGNGKKTMIKKTESRGNSAQNLWETAIHLWKNRMPATKCPPAVPFWLCNSLKITQTVF